MGFIQPRYLSAQDAAIYLGIGQDERAIDTLYQWVHRGRVPYQKVGRTLRFDVRELDKFMAARRVQAREVA